MGKLDLSLSHHRVRAPSFPAPRYNKLESERPSLPITQLNNPAPYKPKVNRKCDTATQSSVKKNFGNFTLFHFSVKLPYTTIVRSKPLLKNHSKTTPFFLSIRPPLGLLPVLGPLDVVHDFYTWRSPALYSSMWRGNIYISMNMQPCSLHAHITHVCG